MRTRGWIIIMLALAVLLCGCTQQEDVMQDGYYTAEAAEFDEHGWKEYITIYVSDNRILTIEYDAYNSSGFVRSWDINYMRNMALHSDTYPNEFTRIYTVSLLNWQSPAEVDAISGATDSHVIFQTLAAAAIEQSKTGNKQVVLVDISETGASLTEG